MTVTGMEDGDTAVVLYQDANGNWVAIKAVVVNGKLTFKMPKSGTIILLTISLIRSMPRETSRLRLSDFLPGRASARHQRL